MDLGTAIVGIVCVIICALPFVLTGINRKKKELQLITALNNTAKTNDSGISQYDICGNYIIGMDTTKNTLSFVSNVEAGVKEQFVELSSVINCKKNHISRSTKNGKIVQQLNLQLSFVEGFKHDVILEFYNAEINYQLSGELESIEKWNKMIKNQLNH